ncbi:MAG: ATP-binding protein [Myxococcales bacterium]
MEATLRMIVLSPLDAEADRIAQELRRTGYVVDAERVDNGLALRSALGRRPCDVIVSEWSLRHFSAPAAIEMVNGLGLDVPVVILTGTFGEEMAIGAFRAGARDFLLREQIHKLPAVVEREIRLHRARAGARESQSLNRVMLAAAPDGIIEIDRSGDIVEFNPAAEKIFAYSREESLGKPFADLLSAPALWHAHRRDLERALPVVGAEVVTRRIETSAVRKDGVEIPIELILARIDEAQPIFVAFVRDLSDRVLERRKAEERLRMVEEYLRYAQKMEAIGHLAAGMAHDFNNVMTTILASSTLLLEQMGESDPHRGEVLEIRLATERAASFTRQLLSFLRTQPLQPRPVDLNSVVVGVETMLRRLIGKKIELSTSLGDGVGLVEVAPGQMEQVIVNLAINARDAMPSGGKLRIETARLGRPSEANCRVRLSVRDTGTGMSAETMRHLFEPFFTTKPPGKGTGLGLFISQAIVTRNGGSISVRSEPGSGTVFEVYLPVAGEGLESEPQARHN